MTESKVIGRNEPCPCGSGKKYKRCCGVDAQPKLTPPKEVPMPPGGASGGPGGGPGGMDASFLQNMDPQWMTQITQALQRLPRGQVQRLQALMQKAMSGKDVSKEAAEFEKTLPVEFQSLIRNFQPPGAPGAAEVPSGPALPEPSSAAGEESSMSVEEARSIVEKAVESGTLSQEQAQTLLKTETKENKVGRWWRNLAGKKSS